MSRFGDDNEDGLPWEMWQNVVSRVLIGKKAQAALAELEESLLEMPDKRLIEGHLAAEGSVCAVGLYVARKMAQEQGIDLADAIREMQPPVGEDDDYASADSTAWEGKEAGLDVNLAWHLAYLNDEEWSGITPEERYEKLLAFVRRAQGKEAVAA